MTPRLTDRPALEAQRRKAGKRPADVHFLHDQVRFELQDRLELVNRSFTAPAIVSGMPELWRGQGEGALSQAVVVPDAETLNLDAESHDLIAHIMALHWADDPIGQIIQCRRALRPDGLFLAAFLGGQTLHELRACLSQAETEITGGLSPRIAPMTDLRDAGGLLQRAGLSLPVADIVPLRVSYKDAWALMRDLRAMGEANALAQRRKGCARRAIFDRTAALYSKHFSEGDRIIASFDIVFLTGWAPDASQPQPLRPGSATHRLAQALNTAETRLDD